MALLTTQEIKLEGADPEPGLSPTFDACDSAGDTFTVSGNDFLYVKNGDTADHTVTIASFKKCNQGFTHNVNITVPSSGEKMIGPFPISRFGDASNSYQGSISYDAVTSLTIAVIKLVY